jgi:hypothetical protein
MLASNPVYLYAIECRDKDAPIWKPLYYGHTNNPKSCWNRHKSKHKPLRIAGRFRLRLLVLGSLTYIKETERKARKTLILDYGETLFRVFCESPKDQQERVLIATVGRKPIYAS